MQTFGGRLFGGVSLSMHFIEQWEGTVGPVHLAGHTDFNLLQRLLSWPNANLAAS